MRVNRAESGRQAKFSGDAWESWVETQHEKAKHLGILAHVTHTQAIAKVIHGRLTYTKKGDADYVGCLESGLVGGNSLGLARYLAVEAKSTKDARFPRNEISSKQQEHLGCVDRAGGLALLLVEFREPSCRRFAVIWHSIPWQVKRTAESISADDLKGWEVVPECYLKRWHAGGVSSTAARMRRYARE